MAATKSEKLVEKWAVVVVVVVSFSSFLFSSLSHRILGRSFGSNLASLLGRSFGSNLASLLKCSPTPRWSVLAAGAYRPCRSTRFKYFRGIAIWSIKWALPLGCLQVQKFPWAHINAEHSLCFAINDVKLAPFLFTGLSINLLLISRRRHPTDARQLPPPSSSTGV